MIDEKNNLKQAYNKFAGQRDSGSIAPWKVKERQVFLERLNREEKSSLLEIGAGPGKDSLFFQEQGLSVVSVDLAEEMVRLCQEKGLTAYCMDFSNLDFPDEHFDAVFALNCLLHISKIHIDEVLSEIRRILKPGGLFYCGVYGGQNTEGIWEEDHYLPKRFFSMFFDEDIIEVMKRRFDVEDFHTVQMGENTPHFQSMLLSKRSI